MERARDMIKGKNLSNGFWEEESSTIAYLKNKSPTRCLDLKNPFETLYGFKPAVHHLRVFGSKYFPHISKEDRKKLDAKAIKCIFVGYCYDFKAYKMFNPSTHKCLRVEMLSFMKKLMKAIRTKAMRSGTCLY